MVQVDSDNIMVQRANCLTVYVDHIMFGNDLSRYQDYTIIN